MSKIKIAVISDLHGNLEATKKVFEDIKSRNIDKIICLGDIVAKGSRPNECIELVKENCFVVIRGNCDRYFSEEHDLSILSELSQKRMIWNQNLLTKENREYLLSLPFFYEFYMSGSLIRLFHAHPQKDDIVITNFDSIEEKSKMFEPTNNTNSNKSADVVIYGHIHHQYLDKLFNKTLINVGSVGNSFDIIRNDKFDSSTKETTNIHYLITEGELGKEEYGDELNFSFMRIPYDISKELNDIDNNLEPEIYRAEILEGKYRDMKKVKEHYSNIDLGGNL